MYPIPRGFVILPESPQSLDDVLNATEIRMAPGQAKAVTFEELQSKGYYGGVREQLKAKLGRDLQPGDEKLVSRDFNTALEERLNWAVANKEINKGQFDDRKLRFAGYEKDGSQITLYFGPSHFEEHVASNVKSINDLEFRKQLLDKGVSEYKDQFAYYAGNLALNCVIVTSEPDGSEKVLVGLRAPSQRLYPGFWHNVGGFADSASILPLLQSGDSKGVREAFTNAMRRELLEEATVTQDDVIQIREIGLSYGWSSFDINYMAKIKSSAEHVCTKGHFKGKDKGEHSGFVGLTFDDLVAVLAGDKVLDVKQGAVPRSGGVGPSDFVPIGMAGLLTYVGLKDQAKLQYILSKPQYQNLE
ncbi:hypothetical protein HY641_00150 [Candidatus Woesearchaeota archaeon]|nr:hypothetical protein [Candidatus Woesearchaeota archaeon]